MKEKKQFINLLRVMAAVCITNSHFANVWPVSGIASGGMLGDVLFFAISGYCLYHSDFKFRDFGKWYIKRIRRIYVTVVLIALITCLFTGFPETVREWIHMFVYPTQYHFVASIMVLYIIYYIWMHFLKQWQIKIWVSGVLYSIIVLTVYCLTFDKSWYHIDVVEEHFIRFLFFGAMLIGAHIREKTQDRDTQKLQQNIWKNSGICIASVILYFAVRLAVPRFELFSVQILTWIAISLALYFVFRWAESLELFLIRLPEKLRGVLSFIAGITLQIYLVQFPIINRFDVLPFPLNLLVITVLIFVAAVAVYWLDSGIQRAIDCILRSRDRTKKQKRLG